MVEKSQRYVITLGLFFFPTDNGHTILNPKTGAK